MLATNFIPPLAYVLREEVMYSSQPETGNEQLSGTLD